MSLKFDGGRYTVAEAARYAGVPAATLRSWFKSNAMGVTPLLKLGTQSVDGKHVISFLGLIESYVAGHFRAAGVKTPALRRSRDLLRAELRTAYPFAHARLPTAGRQVLRDQGGAELAGVGRKSFFDSLHLDRIDYDGQTDLAAVWRIRPGVMLKPGLGGGGPVVQGTCVKTYVLSNQYHANFKDARFVADLYRVTEADVLRAAAFEAKAPKRVA